MMRLAALVQKSFAFLRCLQKEKYQTIGMIKYKSIVTQTLAGVVF